MLAYYPHYVGLTARALAVLPDRALGDEKRLRVCAFACGPAPEPVALAQYLLARGYETEVLALALLDIVPDRWSWAQAVSLERVLPTCWDRQTFVAEPKAVDINAPNFVDQVTDFVSRSDLVLFQNCLNEFSADQAQVADNAEALIATMKPGAVLLMADINNYPAGRASLETFATAAERGAVVVQSPDELLSVAPAPGRPAVLDAHLFLDGEYPRRRDFEFRCLAARVPR
jgi:hypothetical protein